MILELLELPIAIVPFLIVGMIYEWWWPNSFLQRLMRGRTDRLWHILLIVLVMVVSWLLSNGLSLLFPLISNITVLQLGQDYGSMSAVLLQNSVKALIGFLIILPFHVIIRKRNPIQPPNKSNEYSIRSDHDGKRSSFKNEKSAWGKMPDSEVRKLLGTLSGDYEPTAKSIGEKLSEIWQTHGKYTKAEFAQFIKVEPSKIDSVFDGTELISLSQIIVITKMFNLTTDYFFRPTYAGRFPFWNEDLVKYTVLSLVQPKSAIRLIDNDGEFYFRVYHDLAYGICELHNLLYKGRK